MKTQEQLKEVFCDNFIAYFRSHVAHVNVVGRNFHGDHALLGGIYEDLQEQIDVIAELLRTIDEQMPNDLTDVLMTSSVSTDMIAGSADDLLATVLGDLDQLKICYLELMEVASEEEHEDIENYAQERVLAIGKFIWKLRSTLD